MLHWDSLIGEDPFEAPTEAAEEDLSIGEVPVELLASHGLVGVGVETVDWVGLPVFKAKSAICAARLFLPPSPLVTSLA